MWVRSLIGLLVIAPATLADNKPDVATIYGRIRFVTSFPDYKVKVVDSFADLHVQVVDSFPDKPGRWQMVESRSRSWSRFPTSRSSTSRVFRGRNSA